VTESTAHLETLVTLADRDIDAGSDIAPPIHQTATFAGRLRAVQWPEQRHGSVRRGGRVGS
jgi:hypothetical protein